MPMHQQIDVAAVQLEKALQLFLTKEYICALTLAGAAEEILGKIAQEQNLPSALDERAEIALVMKWLPPGENAKKQFITFLNSARNAAKHRTTNPAFSISRNWKSDASEMLHRACLNFRRATGDYPNSSSFLDFFNLPLA